MAPFNEDDRSETRKDRFDFGVMIGKLVSEVAGLREDMKERHEENKLSIAKIENNQAIFEKKLNALWMYRGRVLFFSGALMTGAVTVAHFLIDGAIDPLLHRFHLK